MVAPFDRADLVIGKSLVDAGGNEFDRVHALRHLCPYSPAAGIDTVADAAA